MLGVALCSLLAVIVLVVVALPHLREGEDLFTDGGRERLRGFAKRGRGVADRGRVLAQRVTERAVDGFPGARVSAPPADPAPVPVRPAPPAPAVRPVEPMTGARSTVYRGTGSGDVVSSRSAAWQEVAESADPATRAAARVVVDLTSLDQSAAAARPAPSVPDAAGGHRD